MRIPDNPNPLMQSVATSEQNVEDELSLADLWDVLRRHVKLIAFLTGLGLAASLAYVLLTPPQWQATAVIQIGQIGQSTPAGQAAPLVEPATRAMERLKLRAFQDAVLNRLKVTADEDDPVAARFRDAFKVRILPNTDLIELKVRADSIEQARQWAEETVALLRERHAELAKPTVQRLKSQLQEAQDALREAESERAKLLREIVASKPAGATGRFSENVLLANLVLAQDAKIKELRQTKLVLEEQLSPSRTFDTSTLDQPFVPEKPVFPKRTLTVALGAFLGLLLGIVAAFLAHGLQTSRERQRERRQSREPGMPER